MQIRSSIITRENVVAAVLGVPSVSFQDTRSQDGWYIPVREWTARDGRRAFEIFLSGTSRHRAQHDREEFAATWDEWGIVIDALFDIDPYAKIGQYDGRHDFLDQTTEALVCNARYEAVGGRKRPDMTAPWLN